MSRPAVVLVGIPGSGKSTVGRLVADGLTEPLIETDALVEAELGLSVSEAFADEPGRAQFHAAQERLALSSLDGGGVVTLGSDAVETATIRAALVGHRVVWLRTSVLTATRRLGMARLGLEVLAAIRTKLDAQLAERSGWYEDVATEVIDTDRLSAEDIAAHILTPKET